MPLPSLNRKLNLHVRKKALNPLLLEPRAHIEPHAPDALLALLEVLLEILRQAGTIARIRPVLDAAVGIGDGCEASGCGRGGEELDEGAD